MKPSNGAGSAAKSRRRSPIARAFYHLDAPIKRIGGLNVTMPYSHVLEKLVVPDTEKIVDAVRGILG